MSPYDERHQAECEVCRRAATDPRPYDPDLCHMDIQPDESGEPFRQCPHLATGPRDGVRLCGGHLQAAAAEYERIVRRAAGLNLGRRWTPVVMLRFARDLSEVHFNMTACRRSAEQDGDPYHFGPLAGAFSLLLYDLADLDERLRDVPIPEELTLTSIISRAVAYYLREFYEQVEKEKQDGDAREDADSRAVHRGADVRPLRSPLATPQEPVTRDAP